MKKGDPANQNIYMPLRKERKSLAGDAAVTNTAKAESLRRRLAEVRGVCTSNRFEIGLTSI